MTEKKEEQPAAMNAFDLISMSKGLNLGNLFDAEQVHRPETFQPGIGLFEKYRLCIDIQLRSFRDYMG